MLKLIDSKLIYQKQGLTARQAFEISFYLIPDSRNSLPVHNIYYNTIGVYKMKWDSAFKVFPVIKCDNIILKEINTSDYRGMYKIFSCDEVIKFINIKKPLKHEDMIKFINFLSTGYKNKKLIMWGIFKKENPSLIIGICGFHSISKYNSRTKIGYALARDYWGQGIMTEALNAITSFGFNCLEVNRIEAFVEPDNTASIKLLEKTGFMKEGLLRQYEFSKQKFVDMLVFSKLKCEYKTN